MQIGLVRLDKEESRSMKQDQPKKTSPVLFISAGMICITLRSIKDNQNRLHTENYITFSF
jgi:hypothetical protein